MDPWDDPEVEIIRPSDVERWHWEQRTRQIREALVGWGHFAGIVGALASVFVTSSWELALFVYPMTAYVIGRGLAHVVTDQDKAGRLLFFGLPPLAGIGGLVVAYMLWERWWAAVLVGGAGALLGNLFAKRVFRRVAGEERLESIRG